MSTLCIHCQKNRRQKNRRGMCNACYRNEEIRELYPSTRVAKPKGERNENRETLEELEAKIAQRIATMPECEAEHGNDRGDPKPLRIYTIKCDRRWNRSLYT